MQAAISNGIIPYEIYTQQKAHPEDLKLIADYKKEKLQNIAKQ